MPCPGAVCLMPVADSVQGRFKLWQKPVLAFTFISAKSISLEKLLEYRFGVCLCVNSVLEDGRWTYSLSLMLWWSTVRSTHAHTHTQAFPSPSLCSEISSCSRSSVDVALSKKYFKPESLRTVSVCYSQFLRMGNSKLRRQQKGCLVKFCPL